jgi:hypothetical protein
MEHRWNETDKGKPKCSTTNPIWTDPGSNPGLRGGRQAAYRLSHGTAAPGLTKGYSYTSTPPLCPHGLYRAPFTFNLADPHIVYYMYSQFWSAKFDLRPIFRNLTTAQAEKCLHVTVFRFPSVSQADGVEGGGRTLCYSVRLVTAVRPQCTCITYHKATLEMLTGV